MEGNGLYFGLTSPDLLRKIDRSFPCNVGEYVDLPQLVVGEYVDLPQLVVGDQASGKSFVLEALTKLPFPRAAVVAMRLVEWHASSDPSHPMTIKKRNPCFDIATLEIVRPSASDVSTLLPGSPLIPWFFRCWLGRLGKGSGWRNFLRGQKARLAIIFAQYRFGIGLLRTLGCRLGERSRLRKVKIDIGWQIINGRADPFVLNRHPSIVHVLGEFVGGPLLLAVLFCEAELADWMAIECSLVSFDHGVMAVDPHRPVVVRDGKGEDLPVQLFLALHRPKKFDKSSYGDGHAVRVLAVGDVQRCRAAFYLAGEEGKVHPRCGHEVGEGLGAYLTHKRLKLFELFLRERRSAKSHGVVGLRTGTMKRDCAVPAFVDTFVQTIEMFSTIDS